MTAPETPTAPSHAGETPSLPGGGSSTLADGQWHRLHPLTPLFKGGLVLIIVAGIVISNMRDRLVAWVVNLFTPPEVHYDEYSGGDPIDWVVDNGAILWVLLAVLGTLLVLIGVFWLVWRFQQFRITEEHVEVRKGIVFRSQRRAPLDRVQGVNLTRPFPARLIGMAKLEVVGAGTDANVPLEYLSTSRAEAVRSDILRLASGARAARDARFGRGPAAGRAHQLVGEVGAGVTGLIEGVDLDDVAPESVVKIPTGRLIGSQLIAGLVWFLFFLLILAVVIVSLIPVAADNVDGGGWMILLGAGLGMGVPLVIATVAVTWAQISKSLRYSIAPTPDGVRITYGLLTTVTETIPPGRIFAVEVSQSLLWRPFGWWIVRINRMSGKSATQQASSSGQQFNIVLPVGTRADVERVLALILPDYPVHDVPLLWEHGVMGPQQGDPYTTMVRRGRWRRPLSWRRHGFVLTDFALLLRRGRVWRKLAVFPLARLQGLSIAQGPIDRAQRVAWMQAHSIAGPVAGSVVGIERDTLVDMLTAGSRAAVAAAAHDRSHRWRSLGDEARDAAEDSAFVPPPVAPPGAVDLSRLPPPIARPAVDVSQLPPPAGAAIGGVPPVARPAPVPPTAPPAPVPPTAPSASPSNVAPPAPEGTDAREA